MSDKLCVTCGRSPAKFRELVKAGESWEVLRDWLFECKTCANVLSGRYTKATGRCVVCNQFIIQHSTCEACGILIGDGHVDTSTTVIAGHKLCANCVKAWKRMPIGVIYAMALEYYLENSGYKTERNKPKKDISSVWMKHKDAGEEYFKRG